MIGDAVVDTTRPQVLTPRRASGVFHAATEMWAQREVTEGKDGGKAVERITEDLRCLSPPVRGSVL